MLPATGLLSASALSGVAGTVLAYIDPGTTTSIFAILTPILALFGMFLGFLLWPFRRAFGALFGRKQPAEPAPEPEAKAAEGTVVQGEDGGKAMPNAECQMPNQ